MNGSKFKRLLSLKKFWLMFLVFGLVGAALLITPSTSANHPVLVEGNCDSPVPGTTLVSPGTCGDFDGDGRIGTAEDTDGADRIFGTLTAAIGPGTGAAAGTGANFNGRIIIVASGRYSETVANPATTNAMIELSGNGHIQIEAAPGVEANIDAVLQGDPAGGNSARTAATGLYMSMNVGGTVTLRNLAIRNFAVGIRTTGATRLFVHNCRIENNLNYGVQVQGTSRARVYESQITATGRRTGVGSSSPAPGTGLRIEEFGAASLFKSSIVNSAGFAVSNVSPLASGRYELFLADNDGGDVQGTPLVQISP